MHKCIRITRAGDIPVTAHIDKHADRLKNLGAVSKAGGVVLMGVGLTAACMQIASTADSKEKTGVDLGAAIGLFLISNPIGWGTTIVLAMDSTAASYVTGKIFRNTYDAFGEIDFIAGTGVDRICK